MNTVTVADALQTWISNAPAQCLDLAAPHTRPSDTPAEHAATHAIALANAGFVHGAMGGPGKPNTPVQTENRPERRSYTRFASS